MPQYKNNHIIPSCILRQWQTSNGKYMGVYQYDMKNKKTAFSAAEGSSPFSFAALNYFYVPLVNDQRVISVEKWFSEMETELAFGLQQLKKATDKPLFNNQDKAHKFLLAILALRHRDKTTIDTVRKTILDNPSTREFMDVAPDRDIDLVVLENMINAATHDSIIFANCEMILLRNPSGKLLMGDRPFLGEILNDGFHFVALSPYFFAAIRKTTHPPHFSSSNINDSFVHEINKAVARHSHEWIIARDAETLDMYKPFADEEKAKDILDVTKPGAPFWGWQLRTP